MDLQKMCRIIWSLVSGRLVNGHDLFICMKWVEIVKYSSHILESTSTALSVRVLINYISTFLFSWHSYVPFMSTGPRASVFFGAHQFVVEKLMLGWHRIDGNTFMLFWSTNLHNFLVTSDWRRVNCIISCSLFCR